MEVTGDVFSFFLAQPQIMQIILVGGIIWGGRAFVLFKWPAKGNGNGTKVLLEKIENLELHVGNHMVTAIRENTEAVKVMTEGLAEMTAEQNRVARGQNILMAKFDTLTIEIARGSAK